MTNVNLVGIIQQSETQLYNTILYTLHYK